MMSKENNILLVEISGDAFFNIIKYLTINEALKLNLVSKSFYEYLKDEKAYSLISCVNLNNYIKFVKFIKPNKFSSFFLSILKDEKNIYSNPHYVKKNINFGINRKQLVENEKSFLKKIILKGEFIRNANFYDISLLLSSHANTLEELHIHGLNDVNCPLFIYSSYGIIFEFFSKEILLNNLSFDCVTKNDLAHIQEILLQKSYEEADKKGNQRGDERGNRKSGYVVEENYEQNEQNMTNVQENYEQSEQNMTNVQENYEQSEQNMTNVQEKHEQIAHIYKVGPCFQKKNDRFKKNEKNAENTSNCDVDTTRKCNEQGIQMKGVKHELNGNDKIIKRGKEKMNNLINKNKLHLLCEHISIVYNCNKKCFEKIKNYKQRINLNHYIRRLPILKVLNLSGIQSYDMIEMFIPLYLPCLKTLNISCYDYFFYFYYMLISIFLYGNGKEVFTRYINFKKTQNNMDPNKKKKAFVECNKKIYEIIKEMDENLIETNNVSSTFQKRCEQDAINYYEFNIKNNEKKVFFTPTYKDKIYMNSINCPVYYADGSYIKYDSDGEGGGLCTNRGGANGFTASVGEVSTRENEDDNTISNHNDKKEESRKGMNDEFNEINYRSSISMISRAHTVLTESVPHNSQNSASMGGVNTIRSSVSIGGVNIIRSSDSIGGANTIRSSDSIGGANIIRNASNSGSTSILRNAVIIRSISSPDKCSSIQNKHNHASENSEKAIMQSLKGKIKKLKRGGYIWLVENHNYKKNVSIEILYLFKNIIENEEKRGRKNIICMLNNLNLEHFSLFNYSLSSPFLWLLLLIKNQNLRTFCILDLCLSHLLSALTFLEAFLKQNLFNFQGMMRRRRKRLGSIYFKFNDEEEIKFVNHMYSKIINELNTSNFTPKRNKVIHIVIYVYNNKKENKQFIKYIRKISRSLWRCNYLVYYSIQYYKYKYFNKYFDIDNLYRDYVINILLSNHKLNQSAIAQRALSYQ
ncbi:CG2-related protein [Plasmodium brasilianum]|uniref:CG2-related protein n=2 Tax=Plasmodium (Plasmodium) TaxID=418103 RepID=A0A1A8WNJ3_PLAMA|nr:CG2-related protein [Plasmodium brasilianum]SBS94451.1 conserved Plasmodium protein, unknown function [Plasmodium malariae]